MIDKISESELKIFETLANPINCAEILFSDMGNLSEFGEKFSKVRAYQYPFLSYESLYFEDPKLSKKENFKIKKGLGDCINFGGRLVGKTLISIIIDVLLSVFHKAFSWGVVSSIDATKIRGVMDKIINVFESHPILKQWNPKSVSHPAYRVNFDNGCLIESVNNNVTGKDPGKNWFQKHADKNWDEEASFTTDTISSKKLMAQSEMGMVERLTGMANFKKQSPVGRKFFDLKNENVVINLPSYANETWDSEKEDAAVKEFGGRQSPGYRTQILGQVVDDGASVYDIERIRLCYKRDKQDNGIPIKSFEINKNNFFRFREILILEKMNNAETTMVALDKGEGAAPSEIIILFKVNGIWKYIYNVTTFKLSPDEDDEVVDDIIQKVEANLVGIDITSGGGKAMLSHLSKKYPENIVPVSFNEKIDIDFEKDEKGNPIYDNSGKPQYKQEFIVDWSIQRLKNIFYNQKIECLLDFKLDQQFDGIVVMKSGQRTVYGSKVANHLHQSIPKDEIILCKINNEITVDTIENLANNFDTDKLQVPSYNKGKLVWNEGKLLKEENKGNKIYDFKFKPSSFLKVTEGHSMLVWDSEIQSLIEKQAKEIKVGDLVLNIDKKIFNTFPEKNKKIDYKIYDYHRSSFKNIKIEITEELSYLMGIYCAEGSSMGANQGVVLYCGADKKLANYVLNLAKKIFSSYGKNNGNIYIRKKGTKVSENIISKSDFYTVVFYGQKLSEFLSFHCGRGSHNKKVPNFMYETNLCNVNAFLRGLYDGDATKFDRLTTTSRLLAEGVLILNGRLDKYSALTRHLNKNNNFEYYINSGKREGYYRNIPIKAFKISYSKKAGKTKNRKKLKLGVYSFKSKFANNKKILDLVEDFNFVEVKEIKIYDYEGFIYDLSVSNNHNFIAGLGNIVVHNSFQVFAIVDWLYELKNIMPVKSKKLSLGIGA